MSRFILAALSVPLAVYSYIEIKTGLPLLTAQIPIHSGSTAPVGEVLRTGSYITRFLQLILSALLLGAPYVAADKIHLGSWCLGRYTPEEQERILPSLRELTGLLALLFSFYFSARIYLEIHDASSHGPLLPADWLKSVDRTEWELLAALAVVCVIIICLYVAKFDELADQD
jgi:hypothetical protein